MPAKATPKYQAANGNSTPSEAQTANPKSAKAEDSNSSDGRTRRKLRKNQPDSPSPAQTQEPAAEDAESRANARDRRRPSLRNNKPPVAARPLGGPSSKPPVSSFNAPSARVASGSRTIPRSRQSSITNASQFNFGTRSLEPSRSKESEAEAFPFLPSVNFDDLHTSIQLGDLGDFDFDKHSQPAISEEASSKNPLLDSVRSERRLGKDTTKGIGESETRIARSSSLIKSASNTARLKTQYGLNSEAMGPPAIQQAKPRRQSHFPSSAASQSLGSGRAPRKSIGPGVLTNSTSNYSIYTDNMAAKNENTRPDNARQPRLKDLAGSNVAARHSVATAGEMAMPSSNRFAKTKSMQPPPRLGSELLHGPVSTLEDPWTPTASSARSPGRESLGPSTPSSSKRMSSMPGHASGLGARTVSPTDARRMKRLSLMPNHPPVPQTPPTPAPEAPGQRARSTIDSPSMIPRKSVTPPSSRTTPDHNRKSYSSVVSISSNTSFNSMQKSNPTRLQQAVSTSRLPTLRSRAESATNGGGEEGVPPVPAIPKAYESPKGEPESPYFMPRKSSLPFDSLSVNSSSTLDYVSAPSNNSSDKETPRPERDHRQRWGPVANGDENSEERASGAQNGRRTMQPLRLPPLNLLPFSTPTSDKITALQDASSGGPTGSITPPPHRGPPKTPSTPMTASKASFFSRNRGRDDTAPAPAQARSSSSHHALRSDNFPAPGSSSSNARAPVDLRPPRKATSPFISSSLPKTSGEFPPLRSKPSVDRSASTLSTEARQGRLTGPRALTSTKASKPETSTYGNHSETEATSFGNSIRRKLSLTRRRSSSKTETEQAPKPPSHESMPPPKLPASATLNGSWTSNSSPTQKTSYLHSRRKSSHPETLIKHDRAQSETLAADGAGDRPAKGMADSKSQPSSKISLSNLRRPGSTASLASLSLPTVDTRLDADDLIAEEEMRKLATKRKKTEQEAKELDELRRRAVPRDRVSPAQALRAARLNIYERGEIVDYKDIYFCGTQDAKKFAGNLEAENVNFGYDDERGDYNIVTGDHLSYRYEVVDILGKGSFGQVVRCVDHKTGGLEAIKIIRNKKRFHQQALVEVNILQKLREWDPMNKYSMVNFTQSFYFRSHLCISTELLGMNLYEFIKIHDFRGFSLKLIRRFTKQMLNSLVLLKSHKVIHCDLKPENILLAHPAHSEIKVIDFGSSCLENEKVYTYIQSRFYRSPEVILGMTYGMPIDMWSLGCILAELLTGYPIFPGENEQEQLACIMEVFGPPDKHLVEKSTRKKLFFDSLGKPRLTVSSKGKRRRPSSKTLQQTLKCDDEPFLDFLTRCLRWDPDRRLKPDEAVHHEFITGVKQVSTRNTRSAAPSSNHMTSASPVKRFNSVQTSSAAVRPLPEPPATALKGGTAARTRDTLKNDSPSKLAPKRHSTVTAMSSGFSKRGAGPAPMTALPKPGGPRSVSGRPDLASAAAAVATTVRRPRNVPNAQD